MNTLKFIALGLLLSASPLAAKPPGDGNGNGDADETAATKALLTSTPWRISGRTWSRVRQFQADGTFFTHGNNAAHGTWAITGGKVVLTFADGHVDTLTLPLNPRGTAGTDSLGGPTVALNAGDTPPAPVLPPYIPPRGDAGDDADETAATKALLTSTPWRISGRTWSWVRHFNTDGTFVTDNYGADHGTWAITADKIVLTFADGHTDTLILPLNPRATPGTDRAGEATAAFALDDKAVVAAIPGQPALAKLRRAYIASLKDLLRQFTANNQPRRAKAVARELEKVSPGPDVPEGSVGPGPIPAIAASAPPVGTWLWQNGSMLVTLHPDGTVTANSTAGNRKSRDRWHWTDKAAGKFEIDWLVGWIDSATLAPDGKSFTVLNNAGDEYTVRNLPQTPVPAADGKKGVDDVKEGEGHRAESSRGEEGAREDDER